MHPAWGSPVAVALLVVVSGCGSHPAAVLPVTGTVSGAGLEMKLTSATLSDDPLPYRQGPPGSHCAVYTLAVRSVDGRRHDLRASDFESEGATAADAVARCGGPQLEPTWIGSQPRTLELTILEGPGAPTPLYWRPN